MSVTKDGDTGRWMSQIRVTDWTGKTIHKKKRGFATKKEALQWGVRKNYNLMSTNQIFDLIQSYFYLY